MLKVLAGLLALVLVRRWGRAFPRRPLLAASWVVSALLAVYGGLFTFGEVLVLAGVIPASETADWTALRWHALFWDPWFLLWGVLLATQGLHVTAVASAVLVLGAAIVTVAMLRGTRTDSGSSGSGETDVAAEAVEEAG